MKTSPLWLLIGIWLCGALPARAELPVVEVVTDTATVTVGDPIRLTLRLRYRVEERPSLPDLSAWLQDFSVRPGDGQGPTEVEGSLEVVRRFELRLYELGRKQIPALAVDFIRASGDTLVRASQPLDVEVVSARTEEEEGIRDIKPPVGIAGGIPLWLAVVVAVVVVALIVAVVFWLLRRRRKGEEELPPLEPVDHAAEFIRIAGMGLVERGDFKIYYSLLSDNLRRYLEQSLGIEAMEQTTGEIAASLERVDLESEIIREAEEYLGFADLVKFARFLPEIERARRAPEGGIAIVRAVDGFVNTRQTLAECEAEPELETASAPAADDS